MTLQVFPPPDAPARLSAETLAAARAGDPSAFEAIYARYRAAIFNQVVSLMGADAFAEDLTQDVFLKAWLGLRTGKYSHQGSFAGWLYRIAINVCLDELRHRKLVHMNPLDGVLADLHRAPQYQPLFVTTDPLDNPATAVERQEAEAWVRQAVAAVPGKAGLVLRLYEGGGLTYGDIAAALGTTQPAIKSLIFRARESIRQSIPREAFA